MKFESKWSGITLRTVNSVFHTYQDYRSKYHYNRAVPSDVPLTTSSPLVRILKRRRSSKGRFATDRSIQGVENLVAAMAGTARFCDCDERDHSTRPVKAQRA